MRFLLFSIILLLAACSNGEPAPTLATADQSPSVVVGEWLDAVVNVDVEVLGATVEPIGLIVIAGVENDLPSAELVALLDGAFDGEAAGGYWRTFRDDFEAIRGVPVAALVVGEEAPIVDEPGFVAVGVSSVDSDGRVIVRRHGDSGWQVDMVATVGTALVGPLGAYLLSVLEGADAVVISDAYRSAVVPALDAAVALDPQNPDLVFETEFIRQLLTS